MLRISHDALQDFIPPYRRFLGLLSKMDAAKHAKYSAAAAERMVGDLFEGRAGNLAQYATGSS